MWVQIAAWRGELLVLAALLLTGLIFHYGLRRPWQPVFWGGVIMGLANEWMTEAEWQYFLKVYLWRDISPFIVLGWGVAFTWWLTASDALFQFFFQNEPGQGPGGFWKLRFTDILVGLPLCLFNEMVGLYILKIWIYSPNLHWDTPIPILGYPLEGLAAMLLFILIAPPAVRFWKGAWLR